MSSSVPVRDRVGAALKTVIDPELRRPITELDMVDSVEVDGSIARVGIKLTIVGCPAAARIESEVTAAILGVGGIDTADVTVTVMTKAERDALTAKLRGGRPKTLQFGPDSLTRIYAITSGKGGVGKSTLTANLGVALGARGLRVGIVDADVFGFSIPGILGIADAKPTPVGELILPPIAHDVKVISIGMFVPDRAGATPQDGASEPANRAPVKEAVSWRGPMLHRTLQQFLTDVYFGDLDILLLDLPPGTGDIAISLGQLLPNAEVVVVTTPQVAAADVAERSALVARQTGQRVIGVVENMSGFALPDGNIVELFGSGGGADVASRLSTDDEPVPLLATIPLSVALRQGGDAGEPLVLSSPTDPAAAAILELAATLAARGRNLSGRKIGLSVT